MERKRRNRVSEGKILEMAARNREKDNRILVKRIAKKKLKERVGLRAWRFEKRLEMGGGSEWPRSSLEELKKKEREGKGGSEKERKKRKFFAEMGVNAGELSGKKGETD